MTFLEDIGDVTALMVPTPQTYRQTTEHLGEDMSGAEAISDSRAENVGKSAADERLSRA
jgi:hypothetical protein